MAICEMCGREFNVSRMEDHIGSKFGYDELENIRRDVGNVCDECAMSVYYADHEQDTQDGISVYDAALIWQSSGYDEDQMFGFTENELNRALI